MENGRLNIDVTVQDLTGHKFDGYPACRAWLPLGARTERPVGSSRGDHAQWIDPATTPTPTRRSSSRTAEIRQPDQVQITSRSWAIRPAADDGLLTAVRYLKDNRLLPRGFDKATADDWVKVWRGRAGHRLHCRRRSRALLRRHCQQPGLLQIDVELRFQPIAPVGAESEAA
jgi:hypothetical protein